MADYIGCKFRELEVENCNYHQRIRQLEDDHAVSLQNKTSDNGEPRSSV